MPGTGISPAHASTDKPINPKNRTRKRVALIDGSGGANELTPRSPTRFQGSPGPPVHGCQMDESLTLRSWRGGLRSTGGHAGGPPQHPAARNLETAAGKRDGGIVADHPRFDGAQCGGQIDLWHQETAPICRQTRSTPARSTWANGRPPPSPRRGSPQTLEGCSSVGNLVQQLHSMRSLFAVSKFVFMLRTVACCRLG